MHVRFNWPRQLTTLTIRPQRAHASCRWFSTRLQWLQCVSNGFTIVLHETNDVKWCALVRKMVRRVRRKTNFLWSYGDKYEKHCYTLYWLICVWIFEKWLNGNGWYYCKLHFMLSCIIWKKKYAQRAHGTKLITGLNNYCMLYRPLLLYRPPISHPNGHISWVKYGGKILYCLFRNNSGQHSRWVIFINSSRNEIDNIFWKGV